MPGMPRELEPMPTHHDERGFMRDVELVTKYLQSCKHAVCTREIKANVKLDARYNLLDILGYIDVEQIGAEPTRYRLIAMRPVKIYTAAEKKSYWVSGLFPHVAPLRSKL